MQGLGERRLCDSGACCQSALPCSLHQPVAARGSCQRTAQVNAAHLEASPVSRAQAGACSPVACWATAEAPLEAPLTLSWPRGFEQRYELGDILGRGVLAAVRTSLQRSCRWIAEQLSAGSFGTVRTAFDRKTGRTLAAKIISKTRDGVDPDRIAHRIQEEVRQAVLCKATQAALHVCQGVLCEPESPLHACHYSWLRRLASSYRCKTALRHLSYTACTRMTRTSSS